MNSADTVETLKKLFTLLDFFRLGTVSNNADARIILLSPRIRNQIGTNFGYESGVQMGPVNEKKTRGCKSRASVPLTGIELE
jgi:hypothetical protein